MMNKIARQQLSISQSRLGSQKTLEKYSFPAGCAQAKKNQLRRMNKEERGPVVQW
jgi:hypothetical protein